jgi:DNA replication and repair protein RecF
MIKSLKVLNLRSHEQMHLQFCRGIFAITGPNGIGKTNLLEAISCVTLGRSFRTEHLKELIRYDTQSFHIALSFEESGVDHTIRYNYGLKGKSIQLNDSAYKTFSPLLGAIPVGIVSPKDVVLIEGAAVSRRKYLNQILCQSSQEYGYHLKRYADALEHKNALLKQGVLHMLPTFDQILYQSGTVLQRHRQTLIEQLNVLLEDEQKALLDPNETVCLEFKPSHIEINDAHRAKEIARRMSLFGPHRDDVVICLNGKEASYHASEGQKRSIVLALRFAEIRSLEQRTGKPTLLLIDDFGAHLDAKRIARLVERSKKLEQCIITAPKAPVGIDAVIDIEELLTPV